MALGPDDDQAAAFQLLQRRHVEAATLIDDRQDLAAQIDDAFEELGRLRKARDLVGYARHFVDRFDGQAELVGAEAEHHELAFLAAGLPCLLPDLRAGSAGRLQPLHDVLAEQLIRRKDGDQPPSLVAPIDRGDAALATGPGGDHRRDLLDRVVLGRKDRARAIGQQPDEGAADPCNDDLLAAAALDPGGEAQQAAQGQERKQRVAKGCHAQHEILRRGKRREAFRRVDDLKDGLEGKGIFLARDIEGHKPLARDRVGGFALFLDIDRVERAVTARTPIDGECLSYQCRDIENMRDRLLAARGESALQALARSGRELRLSRFDPVDIDCHQGLDVVDGQRHRREAFQHDCSGRGFRCFRAPEQAAQARHGNDVAPQVGQPQEALRRLGNARHLGQTNDFRDLFRRQRIQARVGAKRQEACLSHFAA